MIIDLFCNPRTALVTRLSGAPLRVGFRFRGRSYAYNILAEPRGGTVHNTRFNLDVLDAIGVAIQDLNLYFPFTPADDAYVRNFLKGAGLGDSRIAAINTSGGWKTKRWGLDRYAKPADKLIERYGVSIVLTWGPGELEDTRAVQSMMKHGSFVPPETSLKQLGALLKRCSFFVGSDSGPMHLATAVGTPVLGIYGPTNPKLQGPYGEKHLVVRNEMLTCLSCNLLECPIGHPCMLDLSVDTVLAHVDLLVKRNNLFS